MNKSIDSKEMQLSTPSRRGNFIDNVTDAARKTLLSAAMLTGLQTSPSYASSHQQIQKELIEVCNADNADQKNSTLVMKAREYVPMQISYLEPEQILPIVGQIEDGDEKAYQHIEHLRIAEATKIRDMMWKYGAGSHSSVEYKNLMSRLNTGMMGENPKGYNNYEIVGGYLSEKPSNHGHNGRNILDNLVKHANLKVIDGADWYEDMLNMCKQDPDKINIIGVSVGSDVEKEEYTGWNMDPIKEYDKEKNRLIFGAGGNIGKENGIGIIKNKVYQEELDLDENSVYIMQSRAHSKNDINLDRHCLITIGTNGEGDANQTNYFGNGSKVPVGFHTKVLFSGRIFPYLDASSQKIRANVGRYTSSYPNYLNVAMADLCFQMFAEVKDVDELLEMIRSTALKDYIRLDMNGDGDTEDVVRFDTDDGSYIEQPETVELQLINPAGFFREHCLPADTDLPSEIKTDETLPLNKGYYKGIIFNIPGAEVLINGERVAFDNENSTLIKSQNPFTLERRLNGELSKQPGCEGGIEGSIQAVDDERNGLKDLSKTFTVNINDIVNSIDEIKSEEDSDKNIWYTVGGQKLSSQPTKPGVYIHNGNKVVIK